MRINKFTEKSSIWFPLPYKKEDITFQSLSHNEDQHRSIFNDFEGKNYRFASYKLFLDLNINHVSRKYETILFLVKEVGAITTGLMLTFKLILSRWQHHAHDKIVAETMLYERDKPVPTDATKIEYTEARSLKTGSLIIMGVGQRPCKVTAKPGAHGSSHITITAKDVFTDEYYAETFLKSVMFPKPIISETEGTVISYDYNGVLKMIMLDGDTREDLTLPSEAHLTYIATRIKQILDNSQQDCIVTIQRWGDTEQIVAVREG